MDAIEVIQEALIDLYLNVKVRTKDEVRILILDIKFWDYRAC